MTDALINPNILQWARERVNMSIDALAEKLHVNSAKIASWENGEHKPTFHQAEEIASKLHLPFGFLFLSNIPSVAPQIPDLRTVGDHPLGHFSVDLQDLISEVEYKQAWYRDYLQEQGAEPLPFVGQFELTSGVDNVANNIVNTLGITLTARQPANTKDKFLAMLMKNADEAGIWVMRSGTVGNNTHRALEVLEFRGFAICDNVAPVVFLNGKDAPAAQIFTLVHELAHLWIGASGVSNASLDQTIDTPHHRIEKFCNSVAAEVLVPKTNFNERWVRDNNFFQNVTELARFFCVSTIVVARRAVDLRLAEWAEYQQYYQEQAAQWRRQRDANRGGGDFYANVPIKNGRRFTDAVLHSALARSLLWREAGRLLDINPSKIEGLAERLESRRRHASP